MIECTYHSIYSKTSELKDLIDNGKTGTKPKDLVTQMKSKYQLISLSQIFPQLSDINPHIENTIDPATSGFSSDAYEVPQFCY